MHPDNNNNLPLKVFVFINFIAVIASICDGATNITSVAQLRNLTSNQLDIVFNSGSVPSFVPLGLCDGEVLLTLPELFNIFNLKHQSPPIEFIHQHLVNESQSGLLFLVNQIWSGDFVMQTSCNGTGRYIALHTFAKLPLGVAEWSISTIRTKHPNTTIRGRDVSRLAKPFSPFSHTQREILRVWSWISVVS